MSLATQLARRREQLQQDRTFVLPVLGYEDLISARYRVLSYEELRKIGKANEKLGDTSEGEIVAASDTLIRACVELLHDDEPVASGWTPQAVRELFGVELSEGSTARQALRAILPSTQLMLHFQQYDQKITEVVPEIDEEIAGNSEASPTE